MNDNPTDAGLPPALQYHPVVGACATGPAGELISTGEPGKIDHAAIWEDAKRRAMQPRPKPRHKRQK